MAQRRDEVTIVPKEPDAPARGRASYDRDVYTWALEQARLIRAGRLDEIDRDNVAEEIESSGREQFNKLETALRVLLLHMLKWDFQPERRSRSWVLSIKEQRLEIEDVLSDNPGLKPRSPEAIARAYRKARLEAARETGLALDRVPEAAPTLPTTSPPARSRSPRRRRADAGASAASPLPRIAHRCAHGVVISRDTRGVA